MTLDRFLEMEIRPHDVHKPVPVHSEGREDAAVLIEQRGDESARLQVIIAGPLRGCRTTAPRLFAS
jgi:hypothetical protein